MATPPASMITISGPPDLSGKFTSNFDHESTTPNQFTFTDVTAATAGDDYEDSVTISGIPAGSAPISITGDGQYKIGAGSYTSAAGTVSNGQVVTVKLTAVADDTVSATLTVGDVSDVFSVAAADTGAVLLSRMDATTVAIDGSASGTGWGFGAVAGAVLTRGNDGTYDYINGQFPIDISGDFSGDNYIYGGYTPPTLKQELYVTIYACMPGYTGGMKFCKFFGGRDGTGIANTTFGLDYTGTPYGSMESISYGDGSGTDNDTQNNIGLYVPNYFNSGRAGPLPRTIEQGGKFEAAEWGTSWHKFQIHIKMNSGTTAENQINDGIAEVYIDGVMRARGINIYNRHYLNEFLETVNFFGYTRGQTQVFSMRLRDITVSENGWVD